MACCHLFSDSLGTTPLAMGSHRGSECNEPVLTMASQKSTSPWRSFCFCTLITYMPDCSKFAVPPSLHSTLNDILRGQVILTQVLRSRWHHPIEACAALSPPLASRRRTRIPRPPLCSGSLAKNSASGSELVAWLTLSNTACSALHNACTCACNASCWEKYVGANTFRQPNSRKRSSKPRL